MATALLTPVLSFAQITITPIDENAPGTLKATSDNPEYVQAQALDGGKGADNPRASNFQIVTCTGVVDPRTGKGVECNYNQLIMTISRIIQYVLYLLIPILLGMILWVGWSYITANGDPKKLADAKSMIKPVLLGVFFIFSAYLIVYKLILGNLLAPTIGDINKEDIINTGGNQ